MSAEISDKPGQVFCADTTDWDHARAEREQQVEIMIRTVPDRFLGR